MCVSCVVSEEEESVKVGVSGVLLHLEASRVSVVSFLVRMCFFLFSVVSGLVVASCGTDNVGGEKLWEVGFVEHGVDVFVVQLLPSTQHSSMAQLSLTWLWCRGKNGAAGETSDSLWSEGVCNKKWDTFEGGKTDFVRKERSEGIIDVMLNGRLTPVSRKVSGMKKNQ